MSSSKANLLANLLNLKDRVESASRAPRRSKPNGNTSKPVAPPATKQHQHQQQPHSRHQTKDAARPTTPKFCFKCRKLAHDCSCPGNNGGCGSNQAYHVGPIPLKRTPLNAVEFAYISTMLIPGTPVPQFTPVTVDGNLYYLLSSSDAAIITNSIGGDTDEDDELEPECTILVNEADAVAQNLISSELTVVTTPDPGFDYYLLKPWNFLTDPDEEWQPGGIIFVLKGACKGGYDITAVDLTTTPATTMYVSLSPNGVSRPRRRRRMRADPNVGGGSSNGGCPTNGGVGFTGIWGSSNDVDDGWGSDSGDDRPPFTPDPVDPTPVDPYPFIRNVPIENDC